MRHSVMSRGATFQCPCQSTVCVQCYCAVLPGSSRPCHCACHAAARLSYGTSGEAAASVSARTPLLIWKERQSSSSSSCAARGGGRSRHTTQVRQPHVQVQWNDGARGNGKSCGGRNIHPRRGGRRPTGRRGEEHNVCGSGGEHQAGGRRGRRREAFPTHRAQFALSLKLLVSPLRRI